MRWFVVASAVPAVAAIVAAAPVAAAPEGYDQATATALVAGVRTEGTVTASGGLVTLDSGSAQVRAALDDGPSGYVLAAPYEPGGLVRAAVGQVNTGAGQPVLDVPDAEATWPGAPHSQRVEAVPGTTAGPLAVVGGHAAAEASAHRVGGTATGTSLGLAGVLSVGASTSEVLLDVDAADGRVVSQARSAVASVDVAGVLHLSHVVGEARVTARGAAHTATQSLTIGGAAVGGQAVTVGHEGVTAVGTPVVPGQTLQDATEQANAVLAAAGVTVRTVGGRAEHDDRSAVADTGGVLVTVTQDLAGTLTVVVGGAVLTETDTPVPVVVTDPCAAFEVSCSADPGMTGPTTTTTTYVPGTPGLPAVAGPAVGARPAQPVAYQLAGQRFSARTALLAFGAWQLLSLSVPTLYALADRRRRMAGAAT